MRASARGRHRSLIFLVSIVIVVIGGSPLERPSAGNAPGPDPRNVTFVRIRYAIFYRYI
jgi:hypothetical protein